MSENQESKNFLEKLQEADEPTKKKWLIGSTAVIMLIVIFVWFAYFNNLVNSFAVQEPAAALTEEEEFTFLETMKRGAANLYGALGSKIRSLGRILDVPRSYIVTPPIN